MHRLLERFGAWASTGVVFVYLIAMGTGTATYFVGHLIGTQTDLAASVGIALAAAVEVHSFLSQRLCRQLWQQLGKLDAALPEWDTAVVAFRVHLGITCGLVAFSVFNSVAFWALVTHPTTAGAWLAVGLRGLIIPLAFLAAGFLTPLQHDASQLLQDAAHTMLRRTVRITIRQWHKRLALAHKSGVDLAPVAVELMEDAHEHRAARQIRIIASALDRAERGPANGAGNITRAITPERPPTGPGSPVTAPDASKRGEPGRDRRASEQAIQLVEPPEWRRKRARTASAERRVRRVLAAQPSISTRMLAKQAKVSDSTASKYRRVWDTEQRGQMAQ